MKTGLFFGTFNPVHAGHMIIASYMAEFTDLDQVWMVLTPHNPLKQKESLLKDHHRLAMLRRAVEDTRKLKVSDIELSLPQPNYTINTLVHLGEKYPGHEFALIVGSDNYENLHRWKNHEQIRESHELYVYPRPGHSWGNAVAGDKVRFIDAPLLGLSSSFIRQSIRNKKDVGAMLPAPVWQYLKEMHFYEKG